MPVLEKPRDIDALLRDILTAGIDTGSTRTLSADDRRYVEELIDAMDGGEAGIVIVRSGDRLKYIVANAESNEAIEMLARVIERSAQKKR